MTELITKVTSVKDKFGNPRAELVNNSNKLYIGKVTGYNYDRHYANIFNRYVTVEGKAEAIYVDTDGVETIYQERYLNSFYPKYNNDNTKLMNNFYRYDFYVPYFQVVFDVPKNIKTDTSITFKASYDMRGTDNIINTYTLKQNKIVKISDYEFDIYYDSNKYGNVKYDKTINRFTSTSSSDLDNNMPNFNLAIIFSCGISNILQEVYLEKRAFNSDTETIVKDLFEKMTTCLQAFGHD